MRKRTRSPNYPSISLPDALERLARLRKEIQWHKAPREVVAKGIGYAKLHGASAGAISALQKYGLLERDGDDLKISDLGKRHLNPLDSEEESKALVEAATNPSLFAELDEQFPGGTSNDDLLQNYLVRKGFSQVALPSVLRAYRETLELVAQRAGITIRILKALIQSGSLNRLQLFTPEVIRWSPTPQPHQFQLPIRESFSFP